MKKYILIISLVFINIQAMGQVDDENRLTKWHVGFKRANHVVTVLPSPIAFDILVSVPLRIGVARDVQPMPGPAFAVVRRGEQFIDELAAFRGLLEKSDAHDAALREHLDAAGLTRAGEGR